MWREAEGRWERAVPAAAVRRPKEQIEWVTKLDYIGTNSPASSAGELG